MRGGKAAQRVVDGVAQRRAIEGLGEHTHGVGVVLEAGRGGAAVAGHEDEAEAQLGRAGARLAVEVAAVFFSGQLPEKRVHPARAGDGGNQWRDFGAWASREQRDGSWL